MIMTDFIIFGEILFDCFKDARTLGGAPLNVACHLSRLGMKGKVVSAVGDDAYGKEALQAMKNENMDISAVAVLDNAPTGRADIALNGKNADYTFNHPAAWDLIPMPENMEKEARIFYFGTLAQRDEKSRKTLHDLLSSVKADHIFCDVNIRKNFYTEEIVRDSLRSCTILKLNEEELPLILRSASCSDISTLMEKSDIGTVILTQGKKGTALYTQNDIHHFDISPVPVVDTVGAGDSFSAGFLASLVKSGDAVKAAETGSILADYVVTKRGAVPPYDAGIKLRLHEEGIL